MPDIKAQYAEIMLKINGTTISGMFSTMLNILFAFPIDPIRCEHKEEEVEVKEEEVASCQRATMKKR